MITSSQFKPAWWLPGTHAQTLWPSLMKRPIEIELTTERLTLTRPSLDDIPFIAKATKTPDFNEGMLWDPPSHHEEYINAFKIKKSF